MVVRIVSRKRFLPDPDVSTSEFDDLAGKIPDRDLAWIADVNGSGDVVGCRHQPDQPVDGVVNVTEAARLISVPINGDMSFVQGLDHKI